MSKKKTADETPSQIDDNGPSSDDKNSSLATAIIIRNDQLESQRSPFMSQWERLGKLVMPRKSYILTTSYTPTMDREIQLFTSCAVQANQTLAAGCMAYITPTDSRWFSFEPPEQIKDQPEVAEYFARLTEIAAQQLARSNFYTTIHELYLDRGCFGTTVMHCEPGDTDDTPLLFRTYDVGTFCIAENHERLVDTVFVKYKMTVRALVMQFGIGNVSGSVRAKYYAKNGTGLDEEMEIIHAMYPREKKDRVKGKMDGPNKAFASIYVEVAAKHLLRNGGYDEKPFFATRFLNWEKHVYGYSPSWTCFADINQLNFLERMLDTLIEKIVDPPVLAPDTMVGQIDARAGGLTVYNSSDPNAKPEFWLAAGNYSEGVARVEKKENNVEEAFYVPMFKQFQADESKAGYPTAEEVRARQAEQLTNFSPTFTRLTTELLTPLLIRLAGILQRLGMGPEIPQALIQNDGRGGESYVPEPKIAFNSRVALAVKNMEVQATDATLKRALNIIEVTQDTSVLDILDTDKILKQGALSDGVDPDYLRSDAQVAQIRQQRAQAAAQQAQMQQQAHVADMAHKTGNIKPDSPTGQAMLKQQQQGAG